VLEVLDSGPGVPPADQPALFDLMQSSKADGLGLGLWLSRYIVERHGGRIDYADAGAQESAHPARGLTGACFSVRIPTG
jgi:signal transduction histidine kinase